MKSITILGILCLLFAGIVAAEPAQDREQVKCSEKCSEQFNEQMSEIANERLSLIGFGSFSVDKIAVPDNSGDCDDSDTRLHPSCFRNSNGFQDPDSDGDGLGNVEERASNDSKPGLQIAPSQTKVLILAISGGASEATESISKRSARTGRNPQTGKEIKDSTIGIEKITLAVENMIQE